MQVRQRNTKADPGSFLWKLPYKTLKIQHLKALLTIGLALTSGLAAEPGHIELREIPSDELATVEQLANTYKIDKTAARQRYREMFGSAITEANVAAGFFEEAKAYEILALALPHLNDITPAAVTAVDALVSKKSFSKKVFDALMVEFDRLVATPLGGAGGEIESGREVVEVKISRAVSRWLTLPEPKVELLDPEPLKAFSAAAKKKAALALVDSPY